MKKRKVPMRKCVACQEVKPKKSLIRIVRTPDSETLIDPTGKKSGRGAYLCAREECFVLAKKKQALDRALKMKVSEEVYNRLQQELDTVQTDG